MNTYFLSWAGSPNEVTNDAYQFVISSSQKDSNSIGSFTSDGIDLMGDSWLLMSEIDGIGEKEVAVFYDM